MSISEKEWRKIRRQAGKEIRAHLGRLKVHRLMSNGMFACGAKQKIMIDPNWHDVPSTRDEKKVTCLKCKNKKKKMIDPGCYGIRSFVSIPGADSY
jgi:hypothetical protein